MARRKATVLLDQDKVVEAQALIGGRSLSATIDVALDRLVRAERLRHDIEAYTGQPPADDEVALGELPVELDLGDDDVDYEALYGRDR
jgi:hypothetical protein